MNSQYLIRRNRRYHFRIRVPKDLVNVVGQREIRRTLRTSDYSLAKSIAQTLHTNAENVFAAIHHQILLGMTSDQINEWALSLIAHQLPRAWGNQLVLAGPAQTDPRRVSLSNAVQAFLMDREHAWEARTRLMHTASLRLFIEIVGDKPIRSMTRHDCRTFRDKLTQLPPNLTKRFKGKSVDDVIALKLEPMSTRTVNKNLSVISTLMNWAIREGLIIDNPARGLGLTTRHRLDAERDVFTPHELKLLFERSPLYTGCASEKHRARPGTLLIRDAKFWLPLIALYSGMRLEEIAQLRVEDVRQVDSVWIFDVNASLGNKLKTTDSARLVPVHPDLTRIGLLHHHADVQRSGHQRLFPDLPKCSDGLYSSAFSKWFGKHKRKVGITNPRVTFHSFRHTVINHLKQSGVEESRIKELVGHKDNSITMSRYGKRYEPAVTLGTVRALGYDLDLNHLFHLR